MSVLFVMSAQRYEPMRNVSFRIERDTCDHARDLGPPAPPARPAADARDWTGPAARRAARGDHAHRPQRRRAPARARLPGRGRAGRRRRLPARRRQRRCRRCCSTTTRRSPSRSGCAGRASGGVAGIEETSLRALAKLEQVLPSRLRRRVGALHEATVVAARRRPAVDPERAHSDRRRDPRSRAAALRLRVRTTARSALRTVEPHRLVHTRGRWYLVAWDVDRDDWRTFRVDRMRPRAHHGPALPAPRGPRRRPRRLRRAGARPGDVALPGAGEGARAGRAASRPACRPPSWSRRSTTRSCFVTSAPTRRA